MRTSCLGGFYVMWVPKLLLTSIISHTTCVGSYFDRLTNNVQRQRWLEGQDLTKGTSLLVDCLSVMTTITQTMLSLSAGLTQVDFVSKANAKKAKKPCEMHQAGQGSPSLRKTLPHSHIPPCSGCSGTPLATPPCNLSLEESTAPSQWMTSDAWATKPPSSTALTLLRKTVALMKEQE